MRLHGIILWLARTTALLGGVVLLALVLLTVLSVAGRSGNGLMHAGWVQAMAPGLADRLLAAGLGPVTGDFELVESGLAFCIFAFLPLAQVTGAHASVDLFTAALPHRANRALTALWDIVFAAALIIIAWRLSEGMLGKMRYNETTFLLQMPVWWSYAAALAAAIVAALTALYCALLRLAEAALGRALAPEGDETA